VRKRRGSYLNQNEENQAEVVISRGDWEGFLASLERLITLHQKTLQRLRGLATRNVAIRTELRSALALPTLETKPKMDGTASEALLPVQLCRYCANEIASSVKFCDRCGMVNAALICRCGNELATSDRFCDKCGRSLILT
jgi:hypothetical protein